MDICTAAAADTYLNYASQNNPNIDVQTGKIEVGNFLQLIRDINDIDYDIVLNGSTDLKLEEKRAKIRELEVSKLTLPTPDQLDSINLNCQDDSFFEVLTGNIRNAIISF